MSGVKHRHRHEDAGRDIVSETRLPYWKRAHHDWRFWFGLVLMFAAITVYIVSDNLVLIPRN